MTQVPFVGTHPMVRELLEAMGLDPSRVRRFSIDIAPDEIVVTTVERYITTDEARKLVDLTRQYHVTVEQEPFAEKEEEPPIPPNGIVDVTPLGEGWKVLDKAGPKC